MHQQKPADQNKCLNFAINFLVRIVVHNEWPWNILWPNEAHFTLDRAVNSQNCHIRGSAHPYVVHEHFCIGITLLYGMILKLILFLVLFSFSRTLLKILRGFAMHVPCVNYKNLISKKNRRFKCKQSIMINVRKKSIY